MSSGLPPIATDARTSPNINESTMTDIIETLLKRNFHAVFGERDPARRRDAIAELFTEDCIFSDSHGRHVGYAALGAAVAKRQAQFSHYVFTERGAAEALRDAGRPRLDLRPSGRNAPHHGARRDCGARR